MTFWHISVPKCRREVQKIARTETPPLLLVCRDDAATGSWSGGVALRLVYGPAGYDFAPDKYFNHLLIYLVSSHKPRLTYNSYRYVTGTVDLINLK